MLVSVAVRLSAYSSVTEVGSLKMAAAAKRTLAAPSLQAAPAAPPAPSLGLASPDAVAHQSPALNLQAELEARLAGSESKWSHRRTLGVSLAISGVLWAGLAAAGAALLTTFH